LENFYMKKTLVAAAILAASGASFAQATITGSYVFGWTSNKTPAGLVSDGLSTDTAAVQFAASEDLGGGTKASAKVSFGGAARGKAVGGEDAYLQLEGGFGKVKMGAVETGMNYDLATPGAGYGFDGAGYDANVTADTLTYTLPAFGAVSVSAGIADYSATPATAGDYGWDAGAGSQSSASLGVAYAGGPLTARLKYSSYRNQELGANPKKNRYYGGVTYALGAANVGLAIGSTTYTTNDASQQVQLGADAAFGAVTVGGKYFTNKETKAVPVNDVKTKGYTLGADYALSKRTSIGAHYRNWTTDGIDGNNTSYRVLVGHAF
jgi:hypothetical protein